MRRATPAFLLLVIKLPPENTIVWLDGGSPAASGFPPDFRLHQPDVITHWFYTQHRMYARSKKKRKGKNKVIPY
jgi:hypothetical protein